jgi:MraZ protein
MDGLFYEGTRMVETFRGRFEAKIDPKGRLMLPAALRSQLPEEDPRVVVTNSQHGGFRFLDLYPFKSWQELEKRIATLPPLKLEVQNFKRFYLSAGQVIGPDNQNRLLLPQSLRKYSRIESDLIMVGMGEKLEIWPEKSWNSLYDTLSQSFDETLETISQLTSGGSESK